MEDDQKQEQVRISVRLDGTRLGSRPGEQSSVLLDYRPARASRRSHEREGRNASARTRRGPAKTLDHEQVTRAYKHIEAYSRVPESDRLKIDLSFYAGLRACEISALTVDDVIDADWRIAKTIRIRKDVAKGGRERNVPMHPIIAEDIRRFRSRYPGERRLALAWRGGRPQPQTANALCVWFHKLFKQLGLNGCSSHSGRRAFITRLARSANQHNSSLRDVQLIAGHSRLETTQAYIEPAENLFDLVRSLGPSDFPHVRGTGGY